MQKIIKIKNEKQPFDLQHWILEQRYKRAVTNTNRLIKEMKK